MGGSVCLPFWESNSVWEEQAEATYASEKKKDEAWVWNEEKGFIGQHHPIRVRLGLVWSLILRPNQI
jgi:hypothetical protein